MRAASIIIVFSLALPLTNFLLLWSGSTIGWLRGGAAALGSFLSSLVTYFVPGLLTGIGTVTFSHLVVTPSLLLTVSIAILSTVGWLVLVGAMALLDGEDKLLPPLAYAMYFLASVPGAIVAFWLSKNL